MLSGDVTGVVDSSLRVSASRPLWRQYLQRLHNGCVVAQDSHFFWPNLSLVWLARANSWLKRGIQRLGAGNIS